MTFTLHSKFNLIHVLALMFVSVLGVILANSPLEAGFWLDETITCWITGGSLRETLSRSFDYQAESSAYFVFVHAWRHLFPAKETILRLPSIFAFLTACFLVYKLGRRLMNAEAGAAAAVLFASTDQSLQAAFSARPYSLALLAALLSVDSLLSWLESGKRSRQLAFILSATAAIYLHYLFGAVLAVHACFFAFFRKKPTITAQEFVVSAAAIGLLLLPTAPKMVHVLSRTENLAFAVMPGISALLDAVLPLYLLIYLGAAAAAALCFTRGTFSKERLPSFVIYPLIVWWILPPVAFFLHAYLTHTSYFLPRLFLWQKPAAALLGGMLLASLKPSRARLAAFCVLFLLIITRESARQWQIEDWRGAARAANDLQAPVLVYSGLVESAHTPWLEDKDRHPYLLSPLNCYPVGQPLIPLPPRFDTDSLLNYYRQDVEPQISSQSRAVLIALQHRQGPLYAHEKLIEFLKSQGYAVANRSTTGLVKVYDLHKK